MRARAKGANLLLWGSCIVLAVVAAVSFVIYIILPSSLEGWRAFVLNLGTEILGIMLTVLLIDGVIRLKAARDQKRYRHIALQQLHVPLSKHLNLFSYMYKASAERKPNREISSLQDLFSEDYFEQIVHFNVLGPSPTSILDPTPAANDIRIPWHQFLKTEVGQFREDLERIVDKYATFLDLETLDLLERLRNSYFASIIDTRLSSQSMALFQGHSSAYNPFIFEQEDHHVQDYTHAFSKLVDIYNREASDDRQVRIAGDPWNDNVSPAVGSSRAVWRRERSGLLRPPETGHEPQEDS